MKRVTLELGGKGAQIVLDDADLDAAAAQILANGFINSGQACIAGMRILVPEHKLRAMQERLVAGLANWPVGSGNDPHSRIGPMVSSKQWERVQSYIALGRQEGARVIAGGEGRPEGLSRGWFVKPTLFGEVDNRMRIAREEIFGPVLCVLPYRNEDHAINIANDTDYGLQNYVIGTDLERCRRVASQLQSGRVVINGAKHDRTPRSAASSNRGLGASTARSGWRHSLSRAPF
jgi:aldehyde dehydrogenase (NAD+)